MDNVEYDAASLAFLANNPLPAREDTDEPEVVRRRNRTSTGSARATNAGAPDTGGTHWHRRRRREEDDDGDELMDDDDDDEEEEDDDLSRFNRRFPALTTEVLQIESRATPAWQRVLDEEEQMLADDSEEPDAADCPVCEAEMLWRDSGECQFLEQIFYYDIENCTRVRSSQMCRFLVNAFNNEFLPRYRDSPTVQQMPRWTVAAVHRHFFGTPPCNTSNVLRKLLRMRQCLEAHFNSLSKHLEQKSVETGDKWAPNFNALRALHTLHSDILQSINAQNRLQESIERDRRDREERRRKNNVPRLGYTNTESQRLAFHVQNSLTNPLTAPR